MKPEKHRDMSAYSNWKKFDPYYLVYESLNDFVYLSCAYVFLYIFIGVFKLF